ncbi:MAG: 30S ribosome-binding factor RbfA [Planctomycetes bacterium]|nr:30S ribosome-binding factor RbfA [Planctomycetota bacterium]MBI3847332.1 30S ribosome-binding factor RbfA [Planctomycetota bacterium]
MPQIRAEKVAKFIKQRISTIILRELHDPRVGFITVTKVKVTSDLKNALVFVSVLGSSAERSKSWHALEKARGFIQRAIADDLDTYTTPEIQFRYDESIEGAIRVSRIVDEALAESRPKTQAETESDDETKNEEVVEDEAE